MASSRVFVVGLGVMTPAGAGLLALEQTLRQGARHLGPLSVFPHQSPRPAPVGEVPGVGGDPGLPRTHRLALQAAREALSGCSEPPEAVVLGGTAGGIPLTEELLRQGVEAPSAYRWHGTGTVAELVAREVGCRGPFLAVATACSSGAVALIVAAELLRQGRARTALAGGVDALCRLTYHGFNMLRLIDPRGARPFDAERAGMTVGEGAALVSLVAASSPPPHAWAEVRGGGLSCDAYHPSAPHPEGDGAVAAMQQALAQAGLDPSAVDYVCLHGTGTAENDAAEAKALHRVWAGSSFLPAHSSLKGALGHAVGAAGSLGAVVGALALREGLVPANVGCQQPDPALKLAPLRAPDPHHPCSVVLANAFGFGGNNAALVLGAPELPPPPPRPSGVASFALVQAACLTGAGATAASLAAWEDGQELAGPVPLEEVVGHLPRQRLRRLKRLSKMALALTSELVGADQRSAGVGSVYLGTRWGSLSETSDFLVRLFESGEQLSSPTDFVGTVHNAVAGQVALWLGATGPNLTVTTGQSSFEDALWLASLLSPADLRSRVIVLGLDEAHPLLSPRIDPPAASPGLTDSGGGLLLEPALLEDPRPTIRLVLRAQGSKDILLEALRQLAGELLGPQPAAQELWYGIPPEEQESGERQLALLRQAAAGRLEVRDYRTRVGQVASAGAAATALAGARLSRWRAGPTAATPRPGVLVVGLGSCVSAVLVTAGVARPEDRA